MDKDLFEKILGEFKRAGGKYLIPQGAGESFLHPQIMEFLRIAKKKFGLKVGLNSNGSVLTPEMCREIVKMGIDDFGFSIDAYSESEFKAITGTDKLAVVESAVQDMVRIRKELGSQFPFIRVLFVEQDANQHEMDTFVRKWIDLVDEVVIQTMRLQSGRKLRKPRIEKRRACRHLFDTVFIQWDGDMTVCCEDWNSEAVVGNIRENSLQELWMRGLPEKYRRLQMNGIYHDPLICKDCEAWAGGESHRVFREGMIIDQNALTHTYRKAG